mgnify:CR=1 FL=1
MRILLTEDDLDLGHALQKGLKTYNYTVDWLKNGKDTLYALTKSQEEFDLIIMDLGLPDIDGIEITNKGSQRMEARTGLTIKAENSGELNNIVIKNNCCNIFLIYFFSFNCSC